MRNLGIHEDLNYTLYIDWRGRSIKAVVLRLDEKNEKADGRQTFTRLAQLDRHLCGTCSPRSDLSPAGPAHTTWFTSVRINDFQIKHKSTERRSSLNNLLRVALVQNSARVTSRRPRWYNIIPLYFFISVYGCSNIIWSYRCCCYRGADSNSLPPSAGARAS
jgi:hypothetical protein